MALPTLTIGALGPLTLGANNPVLADFVWVGTQIANTPAGMDTTDAHLYPQGSLVTYNDNIYVALQENINRQPDESPEHWRDLGDTNIVDEWEPRAGYEPGNLVYYREDANAPYLLYVALLEVMAPADGAADNQDPAASIEAGTNPAVWRQVGGADVALTNPVNINALADGVVVARSNEFSGPTGRRDIFTWPSAEELDTFIDNMQLGRFLLGGNPSLASPLTLDFNTNANAPGLGPNPAGGVNSPRSISIAVHAVGQTGAPEIINLGEGAPIFAINRVSATALAFDLPTGTTLGSEANLAVFNWVANYEITNPRFIAGDDIAFELFQNSDGDTAFTIKGIAQELSAADVAAVAGTHKGGAQVNLSSESSPSDISVVAADAVQPQGATNMGNLGLTITRTDETITFTGPTVANWAQASDDGIIIPTAKLPNFELGNTHTFASTNLAEVPGVTRLATAATATGDATATPAVLAATPITRLYTGNRAGDTRNVIPTAGDADYANTMLAWVVDPANAGEFLLTFTGDDATRAQTDLQTTFASTEAVNHFGLYLLAAAPTDQGTVDPRIVSDTDGEHIFSTEVTAHVPAGNDAGEILAAVVANNGQQRDGDAPIEWHPGDLLVIAGDAADTSDNGIYVYVGPNQTAAESPLTFAGATTPEEVFQGLFRVVVSADTEVQTTYTVRDQSQGSLNSIDYNDQTDQLTITGSAAGSERVIDLPEHIADAAVEGANPVPVNGFINHIKIGEEVYRFGPEPELPVLALARTPTSLPLYASAAQTSTFTLSGTQDITIYDPQNSQANLVLGGQTFVGAPTNVNGYDASHLTSTGSVATYAIPAAENISSTDTLVFSEADGSSFGTVRGDGTTAIDFDNDFSTPVSIASFGVIDNAAFVQVAPATGTFTNVNIVMVRDGNDVRVTFSGDAAEIAALIPLANAQAADNVWTFRIAATPTATATGDYEFRGAAITSASPTVRNPANIQTTAGANLVVTADASVTNSIANVDVTYTTDQIADVSATVSFVDARQAPALASTARINHSVLDSTAQSTSFRNINPTDTQIANGTRYDVAGWQVTATAAGVTQTAISTAGNYAHAPTSEAIGTAITASDSGNGARSISRTYTFNFPMVDVPRNLQPDVDPANHTREVVFYRPWGWFTGTAAPTAAAGAGTPIAGSLTFNQQGLPLNQNITFTGNNGDTIYLIIPTADVTGFDFSNLRLEGVGQPFRGGFTVLGTTNMLDTAVTGRQIEYTVVQSAVTLESTSAVARLITL